MKVGFKQLGLAAVIAAISVPSMAFEAGDWIVRGGATTVAPDASSNIVTANGTDAFGSATLDVDNNTQLGLTVTYMLGSQLGVELLAATPFKHTADASGALGVDVVEVKHLPPTLSAIYYLTEGSDFKPYVGAGLNYTIFFDEKGLGPVETGDVSLDNSFGLSFQAGFDYKVTENWYLNGSVRWIDIDSDVTIDLPGDVKVESDLEIDPLVYSIMFGYKF